MTSRARSALAALVLVASIAAGLAGPERARAGGFYLLDRGTRAMGRGGAFVAGADDPQALWYNPAGLAFSGDQLLLDASMTFFSVDYTRMIVDGGSVISTLPTVHGNSAPLPIPTVAASFDFGLPNLVFALGVYAPNAALMQYPDSVAVGDRQVAAPQRYSLLSMDGSLIANVAGGVAWRPIPELSIGGSLSMVLGAFAARVALSACDGAICTFPEDPDYDGIAQINLSPIVTAQAQLGVTWMPGPVRVGFSVATPYSLSGDASIQVRTPSATAFEGAMVRSRADECASVSDEDVAADPNHACRDTSAFVNLDFPWIVRLGVELLAIENLRIELAGVLETWSVQKSVTLRPNDVYIADALSFLDYEVGSISIPRNMQDTVSVRLGAEYTFDDRFQIRAGGYYENGAFADAYLSPLTLDSDKIVASIGGSVRLFDGVFADAMVGYAHLFARQVRDSAVPQTNPIRPALQAGEPPRQPGDPTFVADGDYGFTAPYFGVGVRWMPDWGQQPATEEEPVAPVDVIVAEPVATPAPVAPEPAPATIEVPPAPTEPAPAEPAPAPARRGRNRSRAPR